MNDDRDEIRRRIDIVELVSQRVRLKRSGKNYSGLCPFHDDKSPSFNVSPTTGRYKCFACGEAGDIFTWVMKTQGLDFREALKQLADQAGVVLSKSFDGPKVDKTLREQQLAVMQSGLIFFRNELKRNTQASSYLDGRGLDAAIQDTWELGYAPDVGEALAIYLSKEGKSLAMAAELFLTQGDPNSGYGDKFRGRVMFPIRDERGDLVGFGGRILGDGHPKYINSSETPLYNKSRVLYGIHRAKDKMMKDGHAVLVEGYLDVIACHRAGVAEAVASCGTALAEGQVKLMKRFADRVTILYDGDSAGQKAAARAIELFEEAELPCKIALLPKGDDPDTLLKSRGPDAIREVIAKAESPFDFRVRRLETDLGIESDEFWREVPKLLAAAPSELDLERHLLRLGGQHPTLKSPSAAVGALRREVNGLRKKGPRGQSRAQETGTSAKPIVREVQPAEAVFLKALLEESYRAKYWPLIQQASLFVTRTCSEIARVLFETFGEIAPAGPAVQWLGQIEDETKRQVFSDLEFDIRVEKLNDTYVQESVDSLQQQSKNRELDLEKEKIDATDDDALRDYFHKLKNRKGIDE
ncbi:MAG: DNA primase [Armatimonadetes bacterium]|nr:DNA primase [Armatimonadota bacterium]